MSAIPSRNTGRARLHADIRRLLSTLMQRDIADPRLIGACITRTRSSHGGQKLQVWVHRPGEIDTDAFIGGLNKLAPHFSYELRRAMPRRRLPELVFLWDDAIEAGGDMVRLLHSLEARS